MNKTFITLSLIIAMIIGVSVLPGCGDSSPSEDVEDAARDAGDAMEDAADEAGDAAEDAVDAAEDAIEN